MCFYSFFLSHPRTVFTIIMLPLVGRLTNVPAQLRLITCCSPSTPVLISHLFIVRLFYVVGCNVPAKSMGLSLVSTSIMPSHLHNIAKLSPLMVAGSMIKRQHEMPTKLN